MDNLDSTMQWKYETSIKLSDNLQNFLKKFDTAKADICRYFTQKILKEHSDY